MQTEFSDAQLATPRIAEINDILRNCVHCGFCTATCPTYVLLGDERDSPRGRIYMIKSMFETDGPANDEAARHIDRCLTCLSCTTTCPSGVDYMHMIDIARAHIEETHKRPLAERALRMLLATVIPRPRLFRAAVLAARPVKPFKVLFPGRLKGLLDMAPTSLEPAEYFSTRQVFASRGSRKMRVALHPGCVQKALAPVINAKTIELLTRLGCEVIVPGSSPCCGALVQHMGQEEKGKQAARDAVDLFQPEMEKGIDAIVINASGCGTTIKDYGHMLAGDEAYSEKAVRLSGLAKDITEVIAQLGWPDDIQAPEKVRVAYHSACSMQHGQKLKDGPPELLGKAGFEVVEPANAHLCCGSAGTYNLMQPELAAQLRTRKCDTLNAIEPEVIATGNIGCITQLNNHADAPVIHTVELLNWAAGGEKPQALQ